MVNRIVKNCLFILLTLTPLHASQSASDDIDKVNRALHATWYYDPDDFGSRVHLYYQIPEYFFMCYEYGLKVDDAERRGAPADQVRKARKRLKGLKVFFEKRKKSFVRHLEHNDSVRLGLLQHAESFAKVPHFFMDHTDGPAPPIRQFDNALAYVNFLEKYIFKTNDRSQLPEELVDFKVFLIDTLQTGNLRKKQFIESAQRVREVVERIAQNLESNTAIERSEIELLMQAQSYEGEMVRLLDRHFSSPGLAQEVFDHVYRHDAGVHTPGYHFAQNAHVLYQLLALNHLYMTPAVQRRHQVALQQAENSMRRLAQSITTDDRRSDARSEFATQVLMDLGDQDSVRRGMPVLHLAAELLQFTDEQRERLNLMVAEESDIDPNEIRFVQPLDLETANFEPIDWNYTPPERLPERLSDGSGTSKSDTSSGKRFFSTIEWTPGKAVAGVGLLVAAAFIAKWGYKKYLAWRKQRAEKLAAQKPQPIAQEPTPEAPQVVDEWVN